MVGRALVRWRFLRSPATRRFGRIESLIVLGRWIRCALRFPGSETQVYWFDRDECVRPCRRLDPRHFAAVETRLMPDGTLHVQRLEAFESAA